MPTKKRTGNERSRRQPVKRRTTAVMRPVGNRAGQTRGSEQVADGVVLSQVSSVENPESALDFGAIFSLKFRIVERELTSIRKKASLKTRGLMSRHVYSIKEVLAFDHWRKIDSYIGKIQDDFQHWIEAGTLDIKGQRAYKSIADKFNEMYTDLEEEVAAREPTKWDQIVAAVKTWTDRFRRILPIMKQLAAASLGLAGPIGMPLNRLLLAARSDGEE